MTCDNCGASFKFNEATCYAKIDLKANFAQTYDEDGWPSYKNEERHLTLCADCVPTYLIDVADAHEPGYQPVP